MRNLKEIKAILATIYCINQTSSKDEDIRLICQYAFDRILDSNTNMLTLCCVGLKKEDIMSDVLKLLQEETQYIQFKELYNRRMKEKHSEEK